MKINKNSILFTITITFIVSIFFMFISFTILYKHSLKNTEEFMMKRSMDVSKSILRECRNRELSDDLKDHLEKMDFSIFMDEEEQNQVLNNKKLKIKHIKNKGRATVKFLQLNSRHYVHLKTPMIDVLIRDDVEIPNTKSTLIFISILIISLFILLYILTLKKLLKLNILKDKVKNLANEDFDIDCATPNKDEISQLANEFHKTAKKLKQLKESRDIFIRNIMHELKTPIVKGKFLTQLEVTQENKNKMEKVFYRLESLINEFATIEQLISSKKDVEKKAYNLEDVVDDAIDILMCEENEVIVKIKNIKVIVDFKLFSIAIKNLIDNGIKHSSDKKVIIEAISNDTIVFKNKGEKLEYPLEKYYEPFFKGDDVKSNQSFGLGLYIVKNILDANGFDLDYSYEDGINSFIITNIKKRDNATLC